MIKYIMIENLQIIFGPRNEKSRTENGIENDNSDYEIVHLSRDTHPMYSFNAFGRYILFLLYIFILF